MFIYGMYTCIVFLQMTNLIESAVPVFTNIDVPIQVREDVTSETLLHLFNVTDPDGGLVTSCSHTGDSGEFDIRQSLSDQTVFAMYVLAGANIEYDISPSFTLVLSCVDGQTESTSKNVQIDVIPNQPPTIMAASTPISVSENVDVQTLLYSLTVSDVENDTAYCDVQSTSPLSSKFDIWWDSTNSEYQLYLLSNQGLSYSTTSMYTVTMECWDDYGLSTSDVVVFVLPNSAPIITNLPAEQSLDASSTSMGVTVFTVSASDNDSSFLTYDLTSLPVTPDLFAIDQVSGEIRTLGDLTLAVDSAYLLAITVSDTVSSTTEYLQILLSNVNTVPTISNLPAVVYKDEDSANNALIYAIDRSDPDTGDKVTLTFTVWPAVYASKFYLHQGYQLKLQNTERFDYEDQDYFEFQFLASDGKAESGPFNLTVYVNDVLEECVFATSMYYVTMNEGDTGAVNVDPRFIVTDDDVGDTYTLSIDYSASIYSSYFSMDGASGIITFATNYDVDTTYPTEVSLTAVCTDSGGKTGTTTVNVTIEDVNDNSPEFTKTGYISYIDQFDGPSTTVKKINMFCSDADSGINADIEYSWSQITAGSSSFFYMSTQGQVILLTYPAVSMTYGDIHSFTVTATDQGTPSLSGTTRLDIIYKQTNNSASLSVPTTTATTLTTTTDESSASFWSEPVNIIVVILAAAVACLLAGLAVYLCLKKCKKRNPRSPDRTTRKVKPKQDPEKSPFEFWSQQNHGIGSVSYTNSAVPMPSS